MQAGRLDRKITIETPTDVQSGTGVVTQTWATFATPWAEVRPVRGQERFAAAQVAGEIDQVFRIRWLSGVTRKMRISYDSLTWDIIDIAEIGRREGLEILGRVHRV